MLNYHIADQNLWHHDMAGANELNHHSIDELIVT